MRKLELGPYEIEIVNHWVQDDLNGFDLKLPKSLDVDEFIKFKQIHISDENKINYFFDDKQMNGRFGQMLFDNKGNVRLYLTTERTETEFDENFRFTVYEDNADYYNLTKIVEHQESNINTLVSLLVEKGIFSNDEASKFTSYLPLRNGNLHIYSEVPDLQEYLKDTKNTFEDIKDEETF